jgi:hypothetical protein
MRKKGTWKLSVTPGKRVLGKSYWQPSLTALHQKLKLKKKVKYHVLVRLFLQLARQVKVDHKVCNLEGEPAVAWTYPAPRGG